MFVVVDAYNHLNLTLAISLAVQRQKEERERLVDDIIEKTEQGLISKLQAVALMTDYRLLPVGDWIRQMPEFIRDSLEIDYDNRNSTLYFGDLLIDEENFKDYESNYEDEYDPYACFSDITLEEATDTIYEYIKTNKIIGTKLQW